jgi:hypothetical protein
MWAERKRNLKRFFGIALPILIFGQLAYLFWTHRVSGDFHRLMTHPALGLGALLFCLVNCLCGFVTWWWLVNREERILPGGPAYALFAVSSLSKYLPLGKAWQIATFLQYGDSRKVALRSTTALVCATVPAAGTGVLIAIVGLPMVLPNVPAWSTALAALMALVIGFVVAGPHLHALLIRLLGGRFPALRETRLPPTWVFLVIAGCHIIFAWLPEGAAAFCLLKMISPIPVLSSMLWFLIVCSSIAFIAGYAALFAPGGLGIREGMLVLLLHTQLPLNEAIFVTFGLRLLNIAADLVAALPVLIAGARKYRGDKKHFRSTTPQYADSAMSK